MKELKTEYGNGGLVNIYIFEVSFFNKINKKYPVPLIEEPMKTYLIKDITLNLHMIISEVFPMAHNLHKNINHSQLQLNYYFPK